METLLAKARKVAEEAEVFVVTREDTPVYFEANRLKQIQTRQVSQVALRIIKKGRLGFALGSDLSDRDGLVKRAVETAPFGARVSFELPSRQSSPQVKVFDPKIEKVSPEEMVALGEALIEQVRRHTPELLCEARISRNVITVNILNTRGGEVSYRKSIFSLDLEGILVRDTDMLIVGDGDSSCHPLNNADFVAESVLRQMEFAKRQTTIRTGRFPVLFTPQGVFSVFVPPIAAAFNGKIVYQGASPLGNKRGKRAFDKKLSLWDDPTLPYQPRSHAWDDEGVRSQRIALIDKGVVGGFLYDLQTAGLCGVRSTGSASRAMGGLPAPMPSSLLVSTGEASWEDMLGDMKEGLVVELMMGAEQGNVLGGDFSGNVLLGFKVEKGEIVGRVKDTMVSGNIYQALKEAVVLGKDARWVDGFLYTPPIYCARLSVSSKA